MIMTEKIGKTFLGGFISYHWNIGENGSNSVQAVLSYPDKECTIIISGNSYMRNIKDETGFHAWKKDFMNMTRSTISVKKVIIKEGVSSVGNFAFSFYNELYFVSLPKSLLKIGESAFDNCAGLKEINFEGTLAEWKNVVLEKNWCRNSSIKKIICTDGIETINVSDF